MLLWILQAQCYKHLPTLQQIPRPVHITVSSMSMFPSLVSYQDNKHFSTPGLLSRIESICFLHQHHLMHQCERIRLSPESGATCNSPVDFNQETWVAPVSHRHIAMHRAKSPQSRN